MEIFRNFASSFRSVNRMGNEPSSQVEPEQSEPKPVQKTWSPDDSGDSGNEENTVTVHSAPTQPDPEPPPSMAQFGRMSMKQKRNKERKSEATSHSKSGEENSASDSSAHEPEAVLEASVEQTPPESAENEVVDENVSGHEFTYPQLDGVLPQREAESRPRLQRHNTNSDSDEVTKQSSPLSIRSNPYKPRYVCPVGNTYECTKIFATETIAKRHAQTHLSRQKPVCPVCTKSYSRTDKLKKHMLSHSREEITNAATRAGCEEEAAPEIVVEAVENAHTAINDDGSQTQHIEASTDLQDTSHNMSAAMPLDSSGAGEMVNQSSAKVSMSSASVFDEAQEPEVVEETPRPKSRLKRKRESIFSSQPGKASVESLRKRRRRHSMSPPTSVTSGDEDNHENKAQDSDAASSISLIRPKINKRRSARMGNLDNFAKPWTPGSQLHHPIHNPRSPRVGTKQIVQIIVPQTSRAGPSTKVKEKVQKALHSLNSDNPSIEQTPLASKSRKAVYTSPKGKRRADDGVTYSSPPPHSDDIHDSDASEPKGMATSVARRGTLGRSAQKRPRPAENEDGEEDTYVSMREANKSEDNKKPFVCQECKRRFVTEDGLQRHVKKPDVHSNFNEHVCVDCSKAFPSVTKLNSHKQNTGHGDGSEEHGRKGAFSPNEVRKLQNWRRHFCEENDMTIATFNQMMTDSCRRTRDFQWPYRFISKGDFLQEYYDVLPDRNRRSLHRYREREFQNVPEKQEWTEEDDEELTQLVKELGPKWVEIGQRMTRTQDSVNQRWRFKLQYQGKTHQGEWLKAEEEKLKDVVAQVKRDSGLPLDPNADVRIPWDSVSKKMKSKRTAQQCSNKWRLMHYVRKGNIFFKPSEIEQKPTLSSTVATPSRMSLRLSGQTPSTVKTGSGSKKRVISNERVYESDEEDGPNPEQAQEEDETSYSELVRSRRAPHTPTENHARTRSSSKLSTEADGADTPTKRQNPLISRTPQVERSLSQTFAQTQANTSALRAPTTSRKTHTQTEMPTPGISVQHQHISSPWQAINGDEEDLEGNQGDEDVAMAEPELSNAAAQPATDAGVHHVDQEASDTTSSDGSDEDTEDDAEIKTMSTADSKSTESSSSASDKTAESEAEGSEDDGEGHDAQRDSFFQSLHLPSNRSPSSSRPGRPSGSKKSLSHKDWEELIRGNHAPPQEGDSEDESSDEGDIMHH